MQIESKIIPQTKTTMPVQRLKEVAYPSQMSEDHIMLPNLHEKSTPQKEEIMFGMSNNQRCTATPPAIPERTVASNLDQFKEHVPDSKSGAGRRVTSPSSGIGPNPWNARKMSYQSERVMPNDDLALSKARAAGTRNYSPRVGIFKTLFFSIKIYDKIY